jgi:hypothetical protein
MVRVECDMEEGGLRAMWDTGVLRPSTYLLLVTALCGLAACRTDAILRSRAQEEAFRQRYVGKPRYTAMVLRPYEYGQDYLIDLTGGLAEGAIETPRAALVVPLGTPMSVTAIDGGHILARVEGYPGVFRMLVHTKQGTLAQVAEELALVLSETPPIQAARPEMRAFIARQEIARGMSRREVYMTWGQPDRASSSPGASGFLEEWTYFDRRLHLFLTNGVVTNWQQY